MIASIFAWIATKLGGRFVENVLSSFEKHANNETERLRIRSAREQNASNNATKIAINHQDNSAKVIMKAMNFKVFWIAWGMCAISLAAWFSWGMLDSLFNGALPDVAKLPDQLLRYADIVFANIFYSGAGLGAAQILASQIGGRK
ncbi:hypothetical protein ATL17_1564 [Maritalea mobilis]|uniref:Uncharacterized protein n=1 Tax=Maritalea mobilis TaxID=483324 RepID=A0A4R6VJ83_9HYPH|nr:hypothetical protein [Maritalea mobilis]TDQ63558.1 hypothetical protein ATL17_1564 [Maritalea mobilis]